MNNRINWIDWGKAIGIFLVVIGHCPYDDHTAIYQQFIYSFHMPLFFLLSGILFTTPDNFKNLLKKNITSLIIPYILFNIIVFIILIPYYIYIGEDLKKLLFYFLIADGKSPAGACWFIICIFNLKIISYFILKLKLKFQIPIITILVAFCFHFITSKRIDLYFTIDSAIMALPFL